MRQSSSSCGLVLFVLSMLAGTRLLTALRPMVQQTRAQQQRLSVRRMAVLNMTPTELAKILNDKSLRSQYQIVDVREDSELHVALKDKDVIHLPLSRSDVWAEEIVEGTSSLDKDMATVCVCHHGMRSKRVADFLVTEGKFAEVYNLQGGIHEFAVTVDPSIGTY